MMYVDAIPREYKNAERRSSVYCKMQSSNAREISFWVSNPDNDRLENDPVETISLPALPWEGALST
jgi:hypothetical protein